MSEMWELGLHPGQAEVHEPIPPEERCPVCGQPDNCGDCNHYGTPHYTPEDRDEFGHGLGELEVVDDEIDHDDQADLI